SSISQSDMDFLFNNPNEVNVVLLDSQEMRETKGEFWNVWGKIFGIGARLSLYSFNCLFFGKCRDWQVNIRYPMP
ncbi:hypothetical protein, partial [Helicobacter muridarum]